MDTSELGRAVDEGVGGHGVGSPSHPARLSPTLTRSYDPTNPENLERQRTMDEDFAMQLCQSHYSWSYSARPAFSLQSLLISIHFLMIYSTSQKCQYRASPPSVTFSVAGQPGTITSKL